MYRKNWGEVCGWRQGLVREVGAAALPPRPVLFSLENRRKVLKKKLNPTLATGLWKCGPSLQEKLG
jgi:hypothetical protein